MKGASDCLYCHTADAMKSRLNGPSLLQPTFPKWSAVPVTLTPNCAPFNPFGYMVPISGHLAPELNQFLVSCSRTARLSV